MCKRALILLVIFCLLLPMASCKPSTPPPTPVPTVVEAAAATPTGTSTPDTAATEAAAQETSQAAVQLTSQASTQAAATSIAGTAAAATATQGSVKTRAAGTKQAVTATTAARATAKAQGIADAVEQLQKDGILKRSAGKFYSVKDFEESWAQIGWYQYWNTGFTPSNFVLRAHTAWETATRTPDPAGCGVVFRAESPDNHYMVRLVNDGNVILHMYHKGLYKPLARAYYQKVGAVKGEADIMLVVDGNTIAYYVDGKKVLQVENSTFYTGGLALTLLSGTNKDYGTRCTITNIELWDLGD